MSITGVRVTLNFVVLVLMCATVALALAWVHSLNDSAARFAASSTPVSVNEATGQPECSYKGATIPCIVKYR